MHTEKNKKYKTPPQPIDALDYGKLPPQAKELEEAVIAATLVESTAASEVIGFLRSDMFYVDAHQHIWQAIEQLFGKSEPIDTLTVTEQLKQNGRLDAAGGAFYIIQLTNKIGSAAHIMAHAVVVQEKFLLRQVIATSTENIREAYEDTTDVHELIDQVQGRAFHLTESINQSNESMLSDSIDEVADQHEGEETGGIKSGFLNIDRLVPGFLPGENIVIAGRPAMGKTAFALQLAANIASEAGAVAYFSMEMKVKELAKRRLSTESGVSLDAIIRNKLNEDQRLKMKMAAEKLRPIKIIVDDTASQRPMQILSACRKLKRQFNISAIFIDYLQLIEAYEAGRTFDNTEAEISYISRSMKRIAMDIGVPLFDLSQLSRLVESRPDKMPMLSDLRSSGSIEQDADKVMFLYRPEYYGLETDKDGNPTKGICHIIIAKQRNGPTGTAILNFDMKHQKFGDR
jgi:replicative DNA helicase